MPDPDAGQLLRRFEALPGAARLLAALGSGEDRAETYVVGGTVRDLLLDRPPLDVDVVLVGGDPAQLAESLGAGAHAGRVHDRFGTATAWPDAERSVRYDLALARRERYARPGALPEVEPAGIEEDLRRRDVTVNALALGIAGPRRGQLLAPGPAVEDLAAGRLRVLHDASFQDDPTRLLRLARYAGRLGFAVEPHTARLARDALAAGALDTVSGPRLGAELDHLRDEPDPVAGWQALRALGVDAAIAPGFGVADPALARRATAALGSDRAGDAALAVALLGVPEPARRPLLDRLGLEARVRDAALGAARDGPRLAATVPVGGPPSRVLAAVGAAGPVTVALAAALAAPGAAAVLRRWQSEWSRVALEIGGDDLLAAGVRAGPAIGEGLRAALAATLDGRAETREQQLAAALTAARTHAGI